MLYNFIISSIGSIAPNDFRLFENFGSTDLTEKRDDKGDELPKRLI